MPESDDHARTFPKPSGDETAAPRSEEFPQTRWSTVLRAGDASSTVAQAAVERLCRLYWYPLYGFVRRQGHGPEEAQDLTQEFFARFLEKESFKHADQERGRFRTFLLASMKHFLVSEWRKGQAAKRSGGPLLSLDAEDAEQRYQVEPADELAPDKVFDKRWALALLDQVLRRLGEEYTADGRGDVFQRLSVVVWGSQQAPPYAELAAQLHTSEGAVKVAVHRLRQRYMEVLRAEVADTLANPAQVDDELRHLLQAMAE